jgi:hypothetical protein
VAAKRLGHGAGPHVETYAHVIDALGGRRYPDLYALIAVARADLGSPRNSEAAGRGSDAAPRVERRPELTGLL